MLVEIHRRNPFLDPQIKDVLTSYLWQDEPDRIMAGQTVWLDEYRSSTAGELLGALVDCDPSMVVSIRFDDGDYAGITISHPDFDIYEAATVDGEPFISRDELNELMVNQPDDLQGWFDARLGNAWFTAIAVIPQDDPNRLTKE